MADDIHKQADTDIQERRRRQLKASDADWSANGRPPEAHESSVLGHISGVRSHSVQLVERDGTDGGRIAETITFTTRTSVEKVSPKRKVITVGVEMIGDPHRR